MDENNLANESQNENVNKDTSASGPNRSRNVILAIISVAVFLIICIALVWFIVRNRPQDETSPEPTATIEVQSAEDTLWDEIQGRGRLIVGTAANYPPFEYYNDSFELDGLDIAIIQQIGRRLNLDVEFRDMAFDGLVNALQVEQIDLAISAITVTKERAGFVDFSNVYYASADAVVADKNSSITRISSLEETAGLSIGVESGTIYDNWAQTSLVEGGIIPANNVRQYNQIEDAIEDLTVGQIDLVALDLQPAKLLEEGGDVKIVAEGFTPQQLAMAVPKGSRTFLSEVNRVLFDMQNDGTLRKLSVEYVGLPEDALLPLPEPLPTVEPPLAPPPGGCIDSSEFVEDLSHAHGEFEDIPVLSAGETFQKGWRMRNSGTCTWGREYALIPVDGNDPAARMGGLPIPVEGRVEPGQTYDFWADLVAPLETGTYVQYWSMRNNQSGLIFGDRVSVAIEVVAVATPTPQPTQTPVPGITFFANPNLIQQGQCSQLIWKTEDVQAVYLYELGDDWRNHQVPQTSTLTVCPQSTLTYELRVVQNDNSVIVRQVTVSVVPNTTVPQITRFTVDPPNQIALGQCVTVQWIVEGQVNTVNIFRNNSVIWANAPVSSAMQDCPTSTGQQIYSIQATGSGGTSQAQWVLNVVDSSVPVPTSTPTPIPGTPTPSFEPVIYYFNTTPDRIRVNQCVTLSWSVGGNATKVSLLRNSVTVQTNLSFNSSINDCSNSAIGTVIYMLMAQSDFNQTTTQQRPVDVLP